MQSLRLCRWRCRYTHTPEFTHTHTNSLSRASALVRAIHICLTQRWLLPPPALQIPDVDPPLLSLAPGAGASQRAVANQRNCAPLSLAQSRDSDACPLVPAGGAEGCGGGGGLARRKPKGLEVDVNRQPRQMPSQQPQPTLTATQQPLLGPQQSPKLSALLSPSPIMTGGGVPGLTAPLNRRHTSGAILQPSPEVNPLETAAAAAAAAARSQSLSPPLRKAALSASAHPRAMPVYARRSSTSIAPPIPTAGAAGAGSLSQPPGPLLQAPATSSRPGTALATSAAIATHRTASSPTARRDSAIAFARKFKEVPSSVLEAAAETIAAGSSPVCCPLRVGLALRESRYLAASDGGDRPALLASQVLDHAFVRVEIAIAKA